jgi:hypothetical protein
MHFNIISYSIPTYCICGNKYKFYYFVVYTCFGFTEPSSGRNESPSNLYAAVDTLPSTRTGNYKQMLVYQLITTPILAAVHAVAKKV